MSSIELPDTSACPSCSGRGALYHTWLRSEGTCRHCGGSGTAPATVVLDEAVAYPEFRLTPTG